MTDAKQALQRLDSETPAENTSSALISVITRAASNSEVDVEKMERLLAMHERIVARDAEFAFNSAMSLAQAEMPQIKKDAKNSHTNSTYARLETVNKAIVPVYAKHGFSLSFGSADCPINEHRRITCRVLHAKGHSRDYFLDLPLDTVGSQGKSNKTGVQGYGSTISYARRYLACMIFNISTGDDVDGNAGGGDGPEVIIGLKAMVWKLLTKHQKVASGQGWREARQWLTDEMLLDPELSPEDLDAAGWRKLLADSTKKLEGK